MDEDDQQRYPLGEPTNRRPQNQPVPIEGRPGWFTDPRTGIEFYKDPDAPVIPPPIQPDQKGNTR